MATSLAQQLQKLAVPQTSNLKRDKKRVSLLFDPKEAASLPKEVFYQIGQDGFEELKNKNPHFAIFGNTLFHITSRDFERSVQTAEANQKLDKNIKKFLQLVSPYFLLSCTHKALEWLVYRYYVHDYNKDDLIMLILPYHETNLFVRVLQLMRIRDSDLWGWLKPLQKPGIHLAKNTLYNHAASSPSFLKFLSDNVASAIKEHEDATVLSMLFNFYCATFVGAIEYAREIDENHVTQILPSLFKGLKSDIPDFAASAYLIISRLLCRTKLSDKILNKFVEKITVVKVSSLGCEALLSLIVLYQAQGNYVSIPARAVGNLAEKDWVSGVLQKISDDGYTIGPLLTPLFKGVLNLGIHGDHAEVYRVFMEKLLADLVLDDKGISDVINFLLEEYGTKKSYDKETKKWVRKIFECAERLNPTSFDREIARIMNDSNKENAAKKLAFRRIIDTSDSLDQHVIFEKLYHPSPEVRSAAIKTLVKRFHKLKERERDLIKSAVIDRLKDDDCSVVQETLQLSLEFMLEVLDKTEIVPILVKILYKCRREDNFYLAIITLRLLCVISDGEDVQVFLSVLPFMLPVNTVGIPAALTVLNSKFVQNNPGLKSLGDVGLDSLDGIFAVVNDALQHHQLDRGELLKLAPGIPKDDAVSKYLLMVLLCHTKGTDNVEVMRVVIELMKGLKVRCVVDKKSEIANLEFAYKKRLSLHGVLNCLEGLIRSTTPLSKDLSVVDFHFANEGSDFFILTIDFLLKGVFSSNLSVSTMYADTLKVFFGLFCVDLTSKIGFLLNILIARNNLVTPVLQFRAIRTVFAILNDNKIVSEAFIPFLLVGLLNPYGEVRVAVMNAIFNLSQKKVGIYNVLLKHIVDYKEEVLMDFEQVPLMTYNCLSRRGKAPAEIIHNLSQICCQDVPLYLKAGIVKVLSLIHTSEVYTEFSKLCTGILDLEKLGPIESEILTISITQFDENIAKTLDLNTPIWNFIQKSLLDDKSKITSGGKLVCPSILLMSRINCDLYNHLSKVVCDSVLSAIIKMSTSSLNTDLLPAASKVFKHIDLDVLSVIEHLYKMRDVQSPKLDASKRKKRMSVIPTIDVLDTPEWKQGVTVLEFIQNKKKIRNINKLLQILFEILKKCLDFDEQSSVEYPKQLVLTAILHYCDKIDEGAVSKNIFNMELIVQCIRASQNPQTHHHALLVLSRVAIIVPEQVLHHIMAIFTFMGSSVLRHDDAYSFQIINKIIETVIPILVEDAKRESRVSVLRVFVDVILDVPEHRRLPLYKKLLEEIGVVDNLHLFLLLIFEAHVIRPAPKRLDIAADLCKVFPPKEIISSCISLMEFLKTLPQDSSQSDESIINIKQQTPKQFRHFKYTIVTFTSNLLSSKEVITQISQLSDDESMEMEDLFKNMIIHILTYIQAMTKIAEKHANTSQAQYWKVMLHHSYDIMDSLNGLLTSQMFLLVIKGLTTHNLNTVKRRALELLNNKIQHDPEFFKDSEESELYALLNPLIGIIKEVNAEKLETEQEVVIQTALLSLKLFVKMLAPSNPEKFIQILQFITEIVKSSKLDTNITASAILCLSELCSNLRAHAIPCLDKFMPLLVKVLKSQKSEVHPTLLLLSAITALQKILDCLSLFLSPYLEKLLTELSNLASRWGPGCDDPKVTPFLSKLNSVKQKIGSNIPLRVLIPSISRCFDDLIVKQKYASVGSLMDILSESLSDVTPSDLQANLPDLSSLFLSALQFRSNHTDIDCNEVEAHIIKALSNLILKLSETSFRPLYYKLYDWAIRNETKSARAITFYALSSDISASLKGLFVLFAGQFVQNAAGILDSCNKLKNSELYFRDDEENILLLENVLKTLNNVCVHDTQKFVNKERFDVLMQPLVDQLENTLGDYEARAKELVIPCVVNFAVAVGDDALWKLMNYQILLKMRNASVSIRLLGLGCLREVAKKLGEDFLPLLPETIPFLAELLEDEEEVVEKACQKAVQELEKVLGEPLQKYF